MTDIQVRYWQNKESERHNREMERLTGESQAEQARANREKEKVSWYSARNDAAYKQDQMLTNASARALNYANTALTEEKTNTEKANTQYVSQKAKTEEQNTWLTEQKGYTEGMTQLEKQANINLTNAKTTTENANARIKEHDAEYVGWEKAFDHAAQIVGAFTGALRNAAGIFG